MAAGIHTPVTDLPTDRTAELPALREEVRAFLAEDLEAGRWQPRPDSWMTGFDPALSRRLGERGWLGMTWPVALGGGGRSNLERYAVVEELLAAGAPVAAHWFADRQVGPMLLAHGSDEQCSRFLPGIARGELHFAIGMSEPDAGSDLAAVRTRATRVAGGWSVSGTKVWTSHAHRCHFMVALCRTEARTDGDRHAGLSQLLVDLAAPGVDVRPIRSLNGQHDFNEVVLTEVFVEDRDVVGEIGRGWQQVTSELSFERSGPERFLSTMPLLTSLCEQLEGGARPAAAVPVGCLAARLTALRELSLGVAGRLERGEPAAVDAALVKDLGSRYEREVTAVARQLAPLEPDLGSRQPLARLLGEAILGSPGRTLRGGTSEILRGIVARDLYASGV